MDNALVENPYAALEDKADSTIPTATLEIYKTIGKLLVRDQDTNVNRASAANMCVRRRWYQHHGYIPDPLTPRKIVNFLLGDLSERVLLYFIKEALVGPGKLYSEVDFGETLGSISFQGRELELYKQNTMELRLRDGTIITGHADGYGRRSSDGQWELIEIKSAADYGFQSFQDDGPGDYLNQAHVLMMMRDVHIVRFFYLRKSTGHIYDRVFDFENERWPEVARSYVWAQAADPPETPYEPVNEVVKKVVTGRLKLQWQCQYCGFMRECKKNYDIQIEWKSDQFGHKKPNYILTRKEATDEI